MIVPARDEAATLPRLLTTLAQLDDSPHEVIVVDDGSRDATAAVARAHGATVVPAGASPAGWAGKPWACHVGAGVASGTHLLFLDADTWLAPDALGRLLAEHARVGGLVSVQPYHVPQRAYEQLSGYCNVVAMMGTGAFAPHPPAGARAAFGPCLLTTAADYEAAGGHAAAPGAVLEDVLLAQHYRAAGMPVTLFGGGDVVRFRMYPAGVTQLVDGWSKNMASGAAATDRVAAAATVLWVSAGVAVSLAVVTGLARWMRGCRGRAARRRRGVRRHCRAVPVLAPAGRCVPPLDRVPVSRPARRVHRDLRAVARPDLRAPTRHLARPGDPDRTPAERALTCASSTGRMPSRSSSTSARGRSSTPEPATSSTGSRTGSSPGDHFWSRPRRFETNAFLPSVCSASSAGRTVSPRRARSSRVVCRSGRCPDGDATGLQRFAIETRRAELGHWLAAAASPFFVLWNPPLAAALMLVYGFGVNLPFIAIQRYNRMRVERVLHRFDRAHPIDRATERRRSAPRARNAPDTKGSSIPYGSPPNRWCR